jgi:hypothetical protein
VHDATPILAVAPYSPAAQFVQVAAPAREYLPAGQLVHTETDVAPVAALAVPAPHKVHDVAPEDAE